MSDPLSLISAIGGIISLADLIITRSAKLYISTRDCPQEIKALIDETSSLSGLLAALGRRIVALQPAHRAKLIGTPEPQTAVLLDDCQQTLEKVVALITKSEMKPGQGVRNTGKRLVWNFMKDDVAELVAKLERCKTNLQIAMSLDEMEALEELLSGSAEIVRRILDSKGETIQAIQELGNHVVVEMREIEGRRVQSDEEQRKDAQRHEILQWLSSTDHEARHRDVQRNRCENTGVWFLEGPAFTTWLESTTHPLLWCKGMPVRPIAGAGKTFLTSTVVDYLKSHFPNPRFALAQVYCNFKDRSGQTPELILTSIVHQLLSNTFPNIHSHIMSLYEKFFKPKKRPSSQDLFSAIESISKDFTTVFLVVDALDECDEDLQRKDVLAYLKQLTRAPFKILATSRPHPRDINTAFEGSPEVSILANSDDIAKFIRRRIAEERNRGVTIKPDFADVIVEQIILKAGEMFLLASFQIEHVLRQPTQRKMREAANNLVSDLTVTYGSIMDRIHKGPDSQRQLALRILMWMITATRPLHFKELQQAVSIDEGDDDLDDEAFPDTSTIVDLCGSLVTIEEEHGTVRFVHYTVQEYLLEHTAISHLAHYELASTCLTYISFDSFNRNIRSRQGMGHWLESFKESFLGYALQSWGYHLKASGEPEELVDRALSVLSRLPTARLLMAGLPDRGYYQYHCYSQFEPSHCLHIAALLGLSKLFTELLRCRGLRADQRDHNARTPLSWAAWKGHHDLVQLLIHRDDVNCDWKDAFGRTPLSLAASAGQESVIKLLVNRTDIDVNAKDRRGRTPLAWAAFNGHLRAVELLIEQSGVKIESKDRFGLTPLIWAARLGHLKIFELLVEHPEVLVDSKCTSWNLSLSGAAKCGYIPIVQLLVDRPDVDVNSQNNHGSTPLLLAAENGHLSTVELMLSRSRVNADLRNSNGWTPLSTAAERGYLKIVELLIDRPDVDANWVDDTGRKLLSWAARGGHDSVVELLLARNGADVDLRDGDGYSPFIWATKGRHQRVVDLLIAARARNFSPGT